MRRMLQLFRQLPILISFCILPILGTNAKSDNIPKVPLHIASLWEGEQFREKEGAIHVTLYPVGTTHEEIAGGTMIEAQFRNLIDQKIYSVTQNGSALLGSRATLWKLPSGKYEILSVKWTNLKSVRSTPPGIKFKRFDVRRQSISELGVWKLKPAGNHIDLAAEISANQMESKDLDPEVVAFTINGFSGVVLKQIGGNAASNGSANNYSSGSRLRATYTTTRTISMFYKLDLFRQNQFARFVSDILKANDANLRECYSSRIEEVPTLKGNIEFSFVISSATSTMSKIQQSGGTLVDGEVASCLIQELQKMYFQIGVSAVGKLTYTFDYSN